MREIRTFANGYLARPLLHCGGDEIESYAIAEGLSWLDDPSNTDQRFLRNRLRHVLLPALESAYPGAARGLQRLARIQAEIADGLDVRCDEILSRDDLPTHQVAVSRLSECGADLRAFVLKRAISRAGLAPAGERHLREIIEQLCTAGPAAAPIVAWGNNQVRRYRDILYFMRALAAPRTAAPLSWQPGVDLRLPWGRLRAHAGVHRALDAERLCGARLSIAFRRGGEMCRPQRRGQTHSLKKLFQEWAVPPWERALTPLIYVDDELAAIGSHCVCEGFEAPAGCKGVVIDWRATIYADLIRRIL